jgi:beta-glucanase (GH16 family)
MANIAFGSKYFIFSKFSSIPKTSKIEADRANLIKEFNDLNDFAGSDELKDFLSLGKYLESKECQNLRTSIDSGRKKEQDKIRLYETQKKSKAFKDYFKFKASQKLKDYNAFLGSKELMDFEELEKTVTSKKFEEEKKKFESQKIAEEKKVAEFNGLKKSGTFKTYFKLRDSHKLKEFNRISESADLKKYFELETLINSKEFQKQKSSIDPKQLNASPEGKKIQELEQLRKSQPIRFYLKFKDSAAYKNFLAFEKSAELKKYNDLEQYLNSAAHKDNLATATKGLAALTGQFNDYLQKKKSKKIKDFYRFQNSPKYKSFQTFDKSKGLDDYLTLEKYIQSGDHKSLLKSIDEKDTAEKEKKNKYEAFKNSKKYKWYLGLKDSDKFNILKKWELVFEDDFNDKQLDRKKWMTRYYWGDKLINDAYAFETDKAFPTDGKNIEFGNSIVKIVTRNEKTKGKMWKPPFGFIPTDYNYTSGLISTAGAHRQKYGRIEAKIKINYTKPVDYHFWMASQMNLPHVDILKVAGKKSKVDMANLYGNVAAKKAPEKKTAEYSGLDVTQDFFIYSLDWTKDKLTWKINGVTVNEQTQGVPQEEMYLVFSCGIKGKTENLGLPASMEIDWVRCYKQV